MLRKISFAVVAAIALGAAAMSRHDLLPAAIVPVVIPRVDRNVPPYARQAADAGRTAPDPCETVEDGHGPEIGWSNPDTAGDTPATARAGSARRDLADQAARSNAVVSARFASTDARCKRYSPDA